MNAAPTRESTWEESRRRLIQGTLVGSLIEWYDIAIYGQAAALVFGRCPSAARDHPGPACAPPMIVSVGWRDRQPVSRERVDL